MHKTNGTSKPLGQSGDSNSSEATEFINSLQVEQKGSTLPNIVQSLMRWASRKRFSPISKLCQDCLIFIRRVS